MVLFESFHQAPQLLCSQTHQNLGWPPQLPWLPLKIHKYICENKSAKKFAFNIFVKQEQ